MRTKTLLLTAALSAAGIATSMAQVYSVNAVGYVNTTLLPGFNLISNPLNNTTGNTIQNLFGTGIQGTIPNGTLVYFFDPVNDRFIIANYDDIDGAFGPAAEASTVVAPGNGVFLFNPSANNLTCTFVGEVMQGEPLNNPLPQGFSIKASQVPQEGRVKTDLFLGGAQGDLMYQWDPVADRYIPSTYDDIDANWTTGTAEPTIKVGEAFYLFKAAAGTWSRTFKVN